MEKSANSKKSWIFISLAIVLVLFASVLTMCSIRSVEGSYEFSLSERDVALDVGEDVQLEIVPDEGYDDCKVKVSWVSEDPSVATVNKDGTVTGVTGGETRVKAVVKYGGKEYSVSCVITTVSPELEYSNYKVRWFTQKKDRSGYEVVEETFERLVGSSVELTSREAAKNLPANYTVNLDKSILTGVVKEQLGICVLEIYHDVAQITYSVDYFYESDSKLGTYSTKESKTYKAYAYTVVDATEITREGFVINRKADGTVAKCNSVVSGSKMKLYYDRIRSTVTISYIGKNKTETYTNVYGVGLLNAPKDALQDKLEPYHVVSYVNGEQKAATSKLMKTLTQDTKVEFQVAGQGFTYMDGALVNTCETKSTDSYVYLQGSGSTIYLSATYDTTGSQSNMFGITLKSGGTSREIRFQSQGVGVMRDHTTKAGTFSKEKPVYAYNTAGITDSAYIWAQNVNGTGGMVKNSVVYNMVKNKSEASHDIIWAVVDGVLYCNVDTEPVLSLPLILLEESWTAEKEYEIGFSAFDGLGTDDDLKIRNAVAKFDKKAKKELHVDEMVSASETKQFVFDPITGAYFPASWGQGSYVYGYETSDNSGISAEVEWINKDNSNSAVGVTIKMGDKSAQYVVEGMNSQVRHQSNHGWNSVAWIQKQVLNLVTPFNENGIGQISAYVKDGYFYITYNGEQAQCINLLSLFPEYTKESKVSLGLYSWDTTCGLAKFSNVELLDKNDVSKVSLDKWGYYSQNMTVDAYDFAAGNIEKHTNKWNYAELFGSAKVWQVEGTLKRTDERKVSNLMAGFRVSSGDNEIQILGQSHGFAKIVNGSWGEGVYTYNGANTTYSFNDITGAFFIDNASVSRTRDELPFKAVIYHDVLYVWFDGEICWRVPLTEEQFGGFEAGSDYKLSLVIADSTRTGTFENVDVKMGYQVTDQIEFVTYNEKPYDFAKTLAMIDANVTRWDTFASKRLTGAMAEDVENIGVYSYAGYAYLKEASDTVYLSTKYHTLENKATKMFGISIRQGTTSREIRFQSQGVTVMQDNSWSAANIPENNIYYYNTAGRDGNYVWAQNNHTGQWAKANHSAVYQMTTASKTPATYKVEWAIYEGVLYGRLDGFVFMQLPLTRLCTDWTADKQYQIGLSQWDIANNGNVKNTDIQLLCSDKAKNKLVTDKKVTATDTVDMAYEAFTGSYIPRSSTGAKYLYGAATSEVQAIKTTIKLVNSSNQSTDSSNGITIKSGNQSAQILVGGNNASVRVHFDHSWGTPNTVAALLPDDVKPYTADGVSEVTAVVKNDKLYLLYNGKQAGSIELYKLLPGYKTGASVQLGIYAFDSSNGLATFSDVAFLSGDKAAAISTTDYKWNVAFFTKSSANCSVDTIEGQVTKNSNNAVEFYFAGESTTWEVSGTITRTDARNAGDMLSGFRITSGNQTLRILAQHKGICFPWYFGYNNGANALAFNPSISDFTNKTRTQDNLNFKAIIANDVLYVWFGFEGEELVPSWRVPLNQSIAEASFVGFTTGTEYGFGFEIRDGSSRGNINSINVKTGSVVDMNAVEEFEEFYDELGY